MAKTTFKRKISNPFLGVSKEIQAATYEEWVEKADAQRKRWKDQELHEKNKQKAEQQTQIAQELLSACDTYLKRAVGKSQRGIQREYSEPELRIQPPPVYQEPKERFNLFEWLIPSLKSKRLIKEAEDKESYANLYKEYLERKEEHQRKVEFEKAKLQQTHKQFIKGNPDVIEKVVMEHLKTLTFPFSFPIQFSVTCDKELSVVLIDLFLPTKDRFPAVEEVTWVKMKNEFKYKYLKEKELDNRFEDLQYQILLRFLHELNCMLPKSIENITINGWAEGIHPATGVKFSACIASVKVERQTFSNLRLDLVVPKTCFRGLRGRSMGSLSALEPVNPVLSFKRDESMFVERREVLSGIDNVTNLAEIDWETFEHLVGELFELLTKDRGADVKVTKQSGDWGIDAVIYDPDPIFGGKTIIQAKRYNILTPSSAVRELAGVIDHERASRGVLVTTSRFGPDAYAFAEDKQITLIDGQKLLGLLHSKGFEAKIELKKDRL